MTTEEDVFRDTESRKSGSRVESPSLVTNLQVGGSSIQEPIHQSVVLQDARSIRKGKQIDAVYQQKLSRLNHKIKQSKRSAKKIDTKCSRAAKKMYKYTKPLKYFALVWLLFVPFVTKQQWCLDKFTKDMPEYATCGFDHDFQAKAIANDDTDNDYLYIGYPQSYIPKLEPNTQAIIDALCYFTLWYFTFIRLFLKIPTKTSKARCAVMSALLFYLIIANILIITIQFRRRAEQQIISFLILMFFIRSLRESWKRIFLVISHSIAIMIIILAYILFFALLGYTLFTNPIYVDPEQYFGNLPDACYNVYVLFTTSNFPDILFPFWKVNNVTAIFFVGFLLIGLYMLLNLMLAVFYNSYKNLIEKKISKYNDIREEFLRKEFNSIKQSDFNDFVTTIQFEEKYGKKVIEQSDRVAELLKELKKERDLGVSKGHIYYDDFAFMYLYLEFENHKQQTRRASKNQSKIVKPKRRSSPEQEEGGLGLKKKTT